ncbi:MAG: Ig domain-containing protein [Oscillospiraceae bacterium]|nr:Ig domain-containing protein [Oscillospiraceae bacterium]
MSKALVIRGADFSVNKVTTVSLIGAVPCTAISLDKESVAFTHFRQTETLIASVLPADTTDSVVWASSDPNVVTVSDGVLTAVGVGSATITATCGNRSATCTVTAKVIYEESDLYRANGYGIIASPWNSNRMSAESNGAYMAFAMETNVLGNLNLAYNGASALGQEVYPIPLPKKASSLKIVSPDSTGTKLGYLYYYFIDSTTNQTYTSAAGAAMISTDSIAGDGVTQFSIDLTGLASGVDSFTFSFRCKSGNAPADQTTPVVVTIE